METKNNPTTKPTTTQPTPGGNKPPTSQAANANEKTMADKLKDAGKKAEEESTQRRERTVKGSHLTTKFLEIAKKEGLTTEEKSGFTKLVGPAKGRAIYVAKKGGRVDFSGFTMTGPAVVQISEEEARQKHLGKVRGQINFEKDDDTVNSTFERAILQLKEAPPEPTKKEAKKEEAKPTPATSKATTANLPNPPPLPDKDEPAPNVPKTL